LNKNPEIGRVEDALDDEEREFRYLAYSNYKIIYYINAYTSRIVIAHGFDTRQNPDKIKEMD
jgi:plasmid stabilization system protein ParE